MQYRQTRELGGRGSGPAHFAEAVRGLAVDAQDNLLVACDAAIKIFDSGGTLLREWRTASAAFSVAVADDGSVWVGEMGRIEIFDQSGQRIDAWEDAIRLARVTAIGFTGDNVLAADAGNRTIRRYDRSGRFLNDIGNDNRMKGFKIPNGALDLSIDDAGIIHATNPGKHRVERYTPDGELLGHIGRFDGLDPAGFPGCCNPTNVSVVGDRVYLTEKAAPRAKVLDRDGGLVGVISAETFDPASKNMDLVVDSRGRVYVADTARLRIVVFEPVREGVNA